MLSIFQALLRKIREKALLMFLWKVDGDTAPTIHLKDPYAVVGSAEDECLVYSKGWGILKLYVNFPPTVDLVYRNVKVGQHL